MTSDRSKTYLILALVVVLGLCLRFYRLNQVPAGLYIDEIDLGYQARSLLETGKDYRGNQSPFFVRSFNSDRTPLPAFVTVLSTVIFSDPFWQVRGGAALAGTALIILAFLLTRLWTKSTKAALMSAIIFATSPWLIQFSRLAFEGTTMALVYLLGLGFFFAWVRERKDWQLMLGAFILSLSVYTYRTMSLFTPLTFIVLVVIFWRQLRQVAPKVLVISSLIPLVLIGSFLYATTIASADETRIAQISIFSDKSVPIKVMRDREVASGDYEDATIGKAPKVWTKLVFNKPAVWAKRFGENYFAAWSGQFLFLSGDANLRHGTGRWGVLLWIDLLGLLLGLNYLRQKWSLPWVRFLTVWLLLAPIPAATTIDGAGHAHRLLIFGLALLLVLGLGWWQLIEALGRSKFWLGSIVLVWLWCFFAWWSFYLSVYPYTSARSFGVGYREAMTALTKYQSNFDGIAMSQYPDPPTFYYLFWNQISPQKVQEYGTDFSQFRQGSLGDLKEIHPDSIDSKKLVESFEKGVLYLVSPREVPLDLRAGHDSLPDGLKLLELTEYPDHETAFYLIVRE